MDRTKRYKKRLVTSKVDRYVKREITKDNVVHHIIYPVVLSTINGSNDFYYHILQLCWNDKNILKDRRYRQMVCGLRLKDVVDVKNLAVSDESGWFTSSRQNDLAKIGKVAGYFIRKFACSVAEALHEGNDFDDTVPIVDDVFNEFVESLKTKKAVVPVVVKLEISQQSSFDTKRFICVSDELVKQLADGDEMTTSLRCKLITIKAEYHEWAWRLLNMRTFDEQIREINIDSIRERAPRLDSNVREEIVDMPMVSKRKKYPNKLYSSEIYQTN